MAARQIGGATQSAKKNSEAAVAYCWTDFIDEQGRWLRPHDRVVADGDVYAKLLERCFIPSLSNIVVRRHVFDQVGGFDESVPGVDDRDMYLKLAACYHFVCVPAVKLLYRESETSLSRASLLMEQSGRQVLAKAYAQAPASLRPLAEQNLPKLYDYLIAHTTRGLPSRKKGLVLVRLLGRAFRYQPQVLWQMWRKPWVVRGLLKGPMGILLPERCSKALIMAYRRRARKDARSR